MTRIAAEPYTAPAQLTEHQMHNIGLGRNPDEPLAYVADLVVEGIIGSFKAHCSATSREHAERIFHAGATSAEGSTVRATTFEVRNIRIA